MHHNRGFTLVELAILVIIVIIVAVVLIPLARLGGTPRTRNGMQVMRIVRSLMLYADNHDDRFPQLGIGTTTGDTAAARFQELITIGNDPLGPEQLLNPLDKVKPYKGSGPLTTANFSYALLTASSPEWRNNINPFAPIACDRLVGPGSLWNAKKWEGAIAWGDSYVTYEPVRTMRTEMWDVPPASPSAPALGARPAEAGLAALTPGPAPVPALGTRPAEADLAAINTLGSAPGSMTQPPRTVRTADDIFSASDGGAMMEYN